MVVPASTLSGGDQPGQIPGWGPLTATHRPPPRHRPAPPRTAPSPPSSRASQPGPEQPSTPRPGTTPSPPPPTPWPATPNGAACSPTPPPAPSWTTAPPATGPPPPWPTTSAPATGTATNPAAPSPPPTATWTTSATPPPAPHPTPTPTAPPPTGTSPPAAAPHTASKPCPAGTSPAPPPAPTPGHTPTGHRYTRHPEPPIPPPPDAADRLRIRATLHTDPTTHGGASGCPRADRPAIRATALLTVPRTEPRAGVSSCAATGHRSASRPGPETGGSASPVSGSIVVRHVTDVSDGTSRRGRRPCMGSPAAAWPSDEFHWPRGSTKRQRSSPELRPPHGTTA